MLLVYNKGACEALFHSKQRIFSNSYDSLVSSHKFSSSPLEQLCSITRNIQKKISIKQHSILFLWTRKKIFSISSIDVYFYFSSGIPMYSYATYDRRVCRYEWCNQHYFSWPLGNIFKQDWYFAILQSTIFLDSVRMAWIPPYLFIYLVWH